MVIEYIRNSVPAARAAAFDGGLPGRFRRALTPTPTVADAVRQLIRGECES
jgi:hypothetical protein